jgi:uncharacterized protein YjbI with pentapeptide repeats
VADEDHLARLRNSIPKWNYWRSGSEQVPDLSDADLHNLDLHMAILNGANLSGADLSGANIKMLSGTDLSSTNLSGADLSEADLSFAHLNQTDLSKTNLSDAAFWETVLADIDLTSVIGLETCRHTGPSIVDFRTLAKSHPLPLEFLRGVGLPDNLIDYLPSLFSQPIQYYSCFISYSSKDDDFAQRIYADLQGKGVRCWFAPHDLPIGGKILDEIDTAIRGQQKVLLILSEHSIGSDWVEDEVKIVFEEERTDKRTILFPVRLDDTIMDTRKAWASKLRSDRNIGDFRQWKDDDRYREILEHVLRDLTAGPEKKSG